MNQAVGEAARGLVERARIAGVQGTFASTKEMETLVRDTGGVLPLWYAELLTTLPLGGIEIGWHGPEPGPEEDALTWMRLSDAGNLRRESLQCYPGIALLKQGYINLASCSHGSGEPYFLPTDQGDDPPVYQFDHESKRTQVSSRLSELFRTAPVLVGAL